MKGKRKVKSWWRYIEKASALQELITLKFTLNNAGDRGNLWFDDEESCLKYFFLSKLLQNLNQIRREKHQPWYPNT